MCCATATATSAAKAGAYERLNLRGRGQWAAQIRCTARSRIPTVRATARPVRYVAPLGGSDRVSAGTTANVSVGWGGVQGECVLSLGRPFALVSAERCDGRVTGVATDARAPVHVVDAQVPGRRRNDADALKRARPVLTIVMSRAASAVSGGTHGVRAIFSLARLSSAHESVVQIPASDLERGSPFGIGVEFFLAHGTHPQPVGWFRVQP